MGRPTGVVSLNRAEKNHLLFINAMVHKANHLEEEALKGSYVKSEDGKKFLQNLRTGRTWLQKAMQVRWGTLDKETQVWLERNSEIMQLNFSYVKDADRIMKRFLEEDRELRAQIAQEVGPDPLYQISEYAMLACVGCDGSPKNEPNGCALHNAMRTYLVPFVDQEHPACGYANNAGPKVYAIQKDESADVELARLKERIIELETAAKAAKETEQHLEQAVSYYKGEAVHFKEAGEKLLEANHLLQEELQQSAVLFDQERAAKAMAQIQRDNLEHESKLLSETIQEKEHEIETLNAEIVDLLVDAERADQIVGVVSVMFKGLDLLREFTTDKPAVEEMDVSAVADEVCRRIGVPESYIGPTSK